MSVQKFYFKLSGGSNKYYRIYEERGRFFAQFNYRDGVFSGENYTEIGKANNYDDAMTICRSHALQFGKIDKMEFR